jgi:hypothetical protein
MMDQVELARFVGQWTMTADPPGGPPWPGEARVRFAWLDGDGEWTLERAGPPFAQCFRGTFSSDGRTIAGRWELQQAGQEWRTDFDVTYTRVDSLGGESVAT